MKNKLVWNVWVPTMSRPSESPVEIRNIFNLNSKFLGSVYKLYKENDRKKFDKILKDEIRYEMQSRCEYEIGLCEHFPMINDESLTQVLDEMIRWDMPRVNAYIDHESIDVYDEIMMNWDRFEEYCWNNRKLFKQFKKHKEWLDDYYRRCREYFKEKHNEKNRKITNS